MKKLLVISVLLLTAAFVFAGGGGQQRQLMGIVTPGGTHGFTGESILHGNAEANALAAQHGFDYRYLTANEDGQQNNAIETLVSLKPKVIVLWPLKGDAQLGAAQSIIDAKIPLVIYDRFIENLRGHVADISGDNVGIGESMGRYFLKTFSSASGTVNILRFIGDASTVPRERYTGFDSVTGSKFRVIQMFDTGWSQQRAQEHMETYLNTASRQEIESLQAIYTDDDEEVMGVVSALRNYRGPATLNIKLISGVGGRRENMELFTNSGLRGVDFVTYTFSPSFIRDAIRLGLDVMQGKGVNAPIGPRGAPFIRIPFEEIDKTTYQKYMSSDFYKTRYSL